MSLKYDGFDSFLDEMERIEREGFPDTCSMEVLNAMWNLTAVVETDEQLRKRIYYVAGREQRLVQWVESAEGDDLEAIAEEFGLKRHRS